MTMKEITVTGLKVGFAPGVRLGLTDAQYDTRSHNLNKTDVKGEYITKNPVEFREGEVLEVEEGQLASMAVKQIVEISESAKSKISAAIKNLRGSRGPKPASKTAPKPEAEKQEAEEESDAQPPADGEEDQFDIDQLIDKEQQG